MIVRAMRNGVAIAGLAGLLAACSTEQPPPNTVLIPPNAGIYKIGKPYQIQGTWYYPHAQPDYDETGVASWYGPTFHGGRTANGEIFDENALTAAHRTLPMPVNVRVTNLENGKSIIVRVNDRGPYSKGRIIDVSKAAAKLLGFYAQGTAKVRVTYVARADLGNGEPPPPETPPAIANAVPAAPAGKVDQQALNIVPGATVAPPLAAAPLPTPVPTQELPAAETQPTGRVQQVPVPSVTHMYVQAGAFSSIANANRLKERFAAAGDLFISPIDRNGLRLYRVRIGPFDDVSLADAALARLTGAGSTDARIVVDQ
ncbi:MAG: septal ring lytic transglycosylase RlpA family protein [Rhizomicrobium sp.]